MLSSSKRDPRGPQGAESGEGQGIVVGGCLSQFPVTGRVPLGGNVHGGEEGTEWVAPMGFEEP